MTEQEIIELFERCGAILNGHFVYTSGRHGGVYVNKDAVIAHPQLLKGLCRQIAGMFCQSNIEVAAAPAIGGVALTQWAADFLSAEDREVLAVYAEKDEAGLVFRRQYDSLVAGKRVLVLEDIVTTGGSIKKVIDAVRANNGVVAGACVLWNRSGKSHDEELGVPLQALVTRQFESYPPEECPLCQDQVPLTEMVGHAGKK